MKVVIDIEANSLHNPTKVWLIVCKDIETNQYHIFRNVNLDEQENNRFLEFSKQVDIWIGHNFLGYDYPNLVTLCGLRVRDIASRACDTLIASRLVNYSRPNGHSIESYGEEFGKEKIKFNDWTKWSQEMEDYCVRDTDICHDIYNQLSYIWTDPDWHQSITTEQQFQFVCNALHDNGFHFDAEGCRNLLVRVTKELERLDENILQAFPSRLRMVREVTPKITKFGTLNRTDFRFVKTGDLSEYNGGPFCRCEWVDFNPASHKQLIDVLHSAQWQPIDKTTTHKDTLRTISLLERKKRDMFLDIRLQECYDKIMVLKKYGYKINENNLSTLPSTAPLPAKTLARRILYESRRRTLTEWDKLVSPDSRIHGEFQGIGAWTHRMSHQRPNMANIPNDKKEDGSTKLLGKEMRSLWQAPLGRCLAGVDAEGIQLRIFAHYIDDQEFTDALIKGRKADKTDPHSLNQRILGNVCKSRQAAKRFIYALLLGAGIGKLSEVLDTSKPRTEEALDRLLARYGGFKYLKDIRIPKDARNGFFLGLDGRRVIIPGETNRDKEHLCMSGYLQNGEAVVMKMATLKWFNQLKDYDSLLVDLVHDEWQTECSNRETAILIAEMQADSLRQVGEELKLKCPLAGSYRNDHGDYSIGQNWYQTH